MCRLLYGVATIGRLLQIIGLFCRILSLLEGSFAKETYNFQEPTNRSHHIVDMCVDCGGIHAHMSAHTFEYVR